MSLILVRTQQPARFLRAQATAARSILKPSELHTRARHCYPAPSNQTSSAPPLPNACVIREPDLPRMSLRRGFLRTPTAVARWLMHVMLCFVTLCAVTSKPRGLRLITVPIAHAVTDLAHRRRRGKGSRGPGPWIRVHRFDNPGCAQTFTGRLPGAERNISPVDTCLGQPQRSPTRSREP